MDTMMNHDDPLERFVAAPDEYIRRVTEPLQAQLNDVQGQLAQERAQRAQTQTELAQARVQAALDSDPMLAGKWRKINESDHFLRWLAEIDPLSGERRHVLLTRAYGFGAIDPVRNIFRAYVAQQIPAQQRTAERLPFEQGRARPAITDRDLTRNKVWSRPEIAQYFEDCRRGKYNGREAEKIRIEAEILAAARERRVANPPVRNFGDK